MARIDELLVPFKKSLTAWLNKWAKKLAISWGIISEGVAQPSANDPRKFSCLIQLHVDLALSNTNNWRLFGIEAAHQLCPCGPWYHQLVHRVVSRLVKTSGLPKKRGCCTALNFEMTQHQEHQAEIPKGLNPDAQISVIFPSINFSFFS